MGREPARVTPIEPARAAAARRRPGPSPDATRLAVLAAAERLFAERGIHGVSLREIAEAAGQRNNAAVHYHFGGRDELVQALFERRAVHLDRRRAGILADLDAEGRGDDVEGLVRALVIPLTESMDSPQGGSWVRLVAELHADPRFSPFATQADDAQPYRADPAITEASVEVVVRIQEALDLDHDQTIARFFLLTTMIVHAVADREALAATGNAGLLGTPDELAERLVQAAVAIVRGTP